MQAEIDFFLCRFTVKFIFIDRVAVKSVFFLSLLAISAWNVLAQLNAQFTPNTNFTKSGQHIVHKPSRLRCNWAKYANGLPRLTVNRKKIAFVLKIDGAAFIIRWFVNRTEMLYAFVPSFIVALPRNVCLYLFHVIFFAPLSFWLFVPLKSQVLSTFVPRSQTSCRLSSMAILEVMFARNSARWHGHSLWLCAGGKRCSTYMFPVYYW